MDAVLVANPGARSGARAEEVLDCLRRQGLSVIAAPIEEGSDLRQAVREAAEQAPLVVVAGGDGTVAAAVQELAHGEATMGLVPLGTQNNFARSLRIPMKIPDACDAIAHGVPTPVDVGRADATWFANAVTIGISGRIAAQRPDGLKRIIGQGAYALVGLNVLRRAKPFSCTLVTPDAEHHLKTHQLIIASGRHVGETVAGPNASAHDGMLDVTALGDGTRRGLLAAWWASRRGEHAERADTLHLRVPEVRIQTDPPQRLDVDGELKGTTPSWIRVEPRALRVMLPAAHGP